jgi:hypothetical protein
MRDHDFEAKLKAALKAHRVGYTVTWELTPDEFGTDRYINAKDDDARRIVAERLVSGLPAEVEFLEDTHDFGNGNIGSVTREMGPPPWEVLRMVADQLECEYDTATDECIADLENAEKKPRPPPAPPHMSPV